MIPVRGGNWKLEKADVDYLKEIIKKEFGSGKYLLETVGLYQHNNFSAFLGKKGLTEEKWQEIHDKILSVNPKYNGKIAYMTFFKDTSEKKYFRK